MRKNKYPLNMHISSVFVSFGIILGSIFLTVNHYQSQQLIQKAAKEISSHNSDKLELSFQNSIAPILTALEFMGTGSFLSQEKDTIQQNGWLPSLNKLFSENLGLVSLYSGSLQGELSLYKPLYNPIVNTQINAPPSSVILFQSTDMKGKNEFIFFDEKNEIVSESLQNNFQYDPRTQPWYKQALQSDGIHLSQPHSFYWLNESGVTFVRRSVDKKHVVAADFSLKGLSHEISKIALNPQSKLLLFDNHFRPLASFQTDIDIDLGSEVNSKLTNQINNSVFSVLNLDSTSGFQYHSTSYNEEEWSVTLTPVKLNEHVQLWLADATPKNLLLKNILLMQKQQAIVSILLLVSSFFVVLYLARYISKPLYKLNKQAENLRRFEFTKSRYPKSIIKEVNDLALSLELMEHTIHDLLRLLRDTASNRDFDLLTKNIACHSYFITKAESVVLHFLNKSTNQFEESVNHAIIPLKLNMDSLIINSKGLKSRLKGGEVVHFSKNSYELKPYAMELFNSDIYLFPLLSRDKELLGVLTLGYERSIDKAQQEKQQFLNEILSFTAMSKENIDHIQQQKGMLQSFIKILASSIDTKSPYTGKHCQRVPVLAEMLTQSVVEDNKKFSSFSMTDKEWEELQIGAWLHDCGKIITPEYVVDKATKLETIYDRIHEVRMRFEVLKQAAHTDYWKGISAGKNKKSLKTKLSAELQALDKDFEFIAECNTGVEYLNEDKLKRIKEISKRKWNRTISDRLGTSWVEKSRNDTLETLPTMEPVISDKQVHQIPWDTQFNPKANWKENFNLTPGKYQYNRGELYNLSIQTGTLTKEEKFIVNNHIIQTIDMLSQLSYPENLSNVPEIAGNHHEKMDGTGYPRGIPAGELSIPARVLAIADIFEALTASDRPYKKAKDLKEAISIMTKLSTSGHIDPELYMLFLQKGIFMNYANSNLQEEQIVEVDIKNHVSKVQLYLSKLASKTKLNETEETEETEEEL